MWADKGMPPYKRQTITVLMKLQHEVRARSEYAKMLRVIDSNPYVGKPFSMESNCYEVSRLVDWCDSSNNGNGNDI